MTQVEQARYAEDEARWSALMVSAQQGNEADYRQLLREIGDAVKGYITLRIGAHETAEDCVQEVLIAVHQARHTYDAQRPFRPWLFAIVRHKVIDSLRREGSRNKLEALHSRTQATHTTSDAMEDSVSSGLLIQALSAPHREAITQTKIAGLSTAEAASRLQISESALKLRVHRGINRLRKLLAAESP